MIIREKMEAAMFPGFRFAPTDEELIWYYLKNKMEGLDKCVEVIAEIDFCRFEPWDLPGRSMVHSDKEWFFFSTRGRKYPNGSQSRRATKLGYWKATGKERNVKSGANVIGTKRTLVFHTGRAPKGERTEWIMHEYCMTAQSQDSMAVCRLRKNTDFLPNQNGSLMAPRNISATHVDQMGNSEKGKGKEVECCSTKCSSSYDSHSVELNDSVSEAQHIQSNSFVVAEASSDHKDYGVEEDCYADILKDDIINLDESALSESRYPNRSCNSSLQPMVAESCDEAAMATQGEENWVDLSPKCLTKGSTNTHYLVSILLLVFTMLAFCCCHL